MSLSNNDLYFEEEQHKDKGGEKSLQGKKKVKGGSFESFNLSSDVYKAIKKKGYNMPTPI